MSFLTWFGKDRNREVTNEVKEAIFTHEAITIPTDTDKHVDAYKAIIKDLRDDY